jgi:hypothetical protein
MIDDNSTTTNNHRANYNLIILVLQNEIASLVLQTN